MNHVDPRATLAEAPMHRVQVLAVAICVALNALDGFDVLAITYAGPGLKDSWGLTAKAFGWLISSGLISMTVGSLLLSPIADLLGRRHMILICLAVMALGMFGAAISTSFEVLLASRIFTGLGIGGMIPAINSMAAEFSNERNRALSVSLMAVGYPIGGVLGGGLATLLLEHFDWASVFWLGSALTCAMIPIVLFLLPESVDFLLSKQPGNALSRANDVLRRLEMQQLSALPARLSEKSPERLLDIFAPAMRNRTIFLTLAYFFHMFTFLFVLSWIPSVIASAGFSQSQASAISVLVNAGGIMGGVLLGFSARRKALHSLVVSTMFASAATTVLFGQSITTFVVIQLSGITVGFFVYAASVGVYALMAHAFPVNIRATGTGFAVGVGRTGGAMGLVLAGSIIDLGFSLGTVFCMMACGSLFAAVCIMLIRLGTYSGR